MYKNQSKRLGFERFKLGQKPTNTQSSKQVKQESKAGSGGGGGGGRGGKPDPGGKKGWEWFNKDWFKEAMQPQHRMTWLSLAGAAAAWYMLTRSPEEHRQISWQEFRTSYLEQGEVGRSVKKRIKKDLCSSLFFLRSIGWRLLIEILSEFIFGGTEE